MEREMKACPESKEKCCHAVDEQEKRSMIKKRRRLGL